MIEIDGNHLTSADVIKISRYREPVKLSERAIQAINSSREWLVAIMATDRPVYGINTGLGIFSDRKIPWTDSSVLSRNLVLSHAVGTGENLPTEIVRAAMLVRANTLAKGFSGVRVEVIDSILNMLNAGVTPIIPAQGSLGSSGDLCPLSHLALVLSTDEKEIEAESGFAEYQGGLFTGKKAMEIAGIARVHLGPKEGLALINGATFSAAIGAIISFDALYLLNVADVGLAMSLEAMLGCSAAFDARLHEARGHLGQSYVAEHVLRLVRGSSLIDSAGKVQDAYSLRCAPQVHGAARDTTDFVQRIIATEINAATDNPLLFGPSEAISGGNFHGEPVGMVMDFLGIALAEIGAISERRVFRLTDGKLNAGLPPMLVDNFEAAGLNSGLMMPQYTAASLVLENQTLASPDSVHSLPTSAEQEDHNANAMTAARNAKKIIDNTCHILAIELYTAARGLYLRLREMPQLKLGQGTASVYKRIRQAVPYQPGDAWWGPEIDKVKELIHRRELGIPDFPDSIS